MPYTKEAMQAMRLAHMANFKDWLDLRETLYKKEDLTQDEADQKAWDILNLDKEFFVSRKFQ